MSGKSQRASQDLMRAYSLLGQRIARMDKDLAATSCMAPEIRELIAFCEMYHVYFNCQDLAKEVEALKKLGRITWPRKELTDLALRVGDNIIVGEFDGLGDTDTEAQEDDL